MISLRDKKRMNCPSRSAPFLPPLLAVSVADVRQGYVPTSLCRLFVRMFAIACKQRFLKH